MRRTQVGLFVLAIAVATCAAVAFAYHRYRHPSAPERRKELESLTGPTGAALLIGDSITRQQNLRTLCGLPVINAGISGSRVEDWTTLAPKLVRRLKPRVVVYALGVNDTARKFAFDANQWKASYDRLRGDGFTLGLLPVQNPKFSMNRIGQINAMLSKEPGYIPPFATDGLTRDGIHLNSAGKKRWVEQIQTVCSMQPRRAPR